VKIVSNQKRENNMRIRIVSSREEINTLEVGEIIIHLAFRPSNKDIFALVKTCPNVKAIHIPGSYIKTISNSTSVLSRLNYLMKSRQFYPLISVIFAN
jgi:hypothetical protein